MKAILFITASCLLHMALAAPEHITKHHKASTIAKAHVKADVEDYMEAEGPTDELNVELEYGLPAAAKDSDDVDAFGLPRSSNTPFPPDVPSFTTNWKKVGYLDMSDPTEQCPLSWTKISSPRASCGKKTAASCDSLAIGTSGTSYQTVCGRFRGYQVGSPDAFTKCARESDPITIENPYVDGISITYGLPGSRKHIFTYAAGTSEVGSRCNCPCTGATAAPSFVGSDFYCESGNAVSEWGGTTLYSADILWDGQECRSSETMCCKPPNLAWFCKTFPTPISGDMEIRICTDEALDNENIPLEYFELYIK